MELTKKRIALIVVVALIAFLIMAPFTNFFNKAYATDGSTIAGRDVSGMNENEIRTMLANEIAAWTSTPPTIEGGGATLTIDPSLVNFDIDSTLATYNSISEKSWYAIWDKKSVDIPLEVSGLEALKDEVKNIGIWDVEETFQLVQQQVTNLQTTPIEAVVTDTSILENERLTFIIQEIPTTAKSVYDIARALDNTVISADESFSLLEKLGATVSNANTEGLSFVGSLIYYNALHTNTEITERHAQTELPKYSEPGFEALVDVSANKDLSFVNKSALPVKMKFVVEGQRLKVEFYSSSNTNTVSAKVIQSGEVKPKTIVRYTDDLSIGQQRLLQEGQKGARVTVFRSIDGFEEQITRDYYPPVNRVVVKSSRQPITATSDTNNTDNSSKDDGQDVLDLDNNGLPDINQGKGNEPKVDEDGNVVHPPGTNVDKAGNVINTTGGSKK